MHPRITKSLPLAIAGLTLAFAGQQSAAPQRGADAKVGEKVPSFTLPSPLNSDGRTTLDEFRGQPIYVDWWGTH